MTATQTNPGAPIVLDTTGADIPGEAAVLRANGPVVRITLPHGVPAWAITDFDLIKELFHSSNKQVSKDPRQHWADYKQGKIGEDWPLSSWVGVTNMFTAYGNEHRRLRSLVGPAFNQRRTEALRPRISEITTTALDELAEQAAAPLVDIREGFTAQVPLRVISELMGLPADLQDDLRICVNGMFATAADDSAANFVKLKRILRELVERKRDNPADDMTSVLIATRNDDNDRLSEDELVDTLVLMFTAGFDTTVNLIGQAIYLLLTHRPRLAQLRAGVFGWNDVIEETLRYAPPIATMPIRFAVEDIDVGGRRIAAGEAIVAAFAAANRDPIRYRPNPTEFDPTRANKEHLSFGYGSHFCLGAPLARMEASLALSAFFERFPDIEIAEQQPETLDSFIANGHKKLLMKNLRSSSAATAS